MLQDNKLALSSGWPLCLYAEVIFSEINRKKENWPLENVENICVQIQ
jgi:hypothetical protein